MPDSTTGRRARQADVRSREGPFVSDTTDLMGARVEETAAAPATDASAPASGAGSRRRRGTGLEGMVLAELQQVATGLGIRGTARMRKSQLIEVIKEAQAAGGGTLPGTPRPRPSPPRSRSAAPPPARARVTRPRRPRRRPRPRTSRRPPTRPRPSSRSRSPASPRRRPPPPSRPSRPSRPRRAPRAPPPSRHRRRGRPGRDGHGRGEDRDQVRRRGPAAKPAGRRQVRPGGRRGPPPRPP